MLKITDLTTLEILDSRGNPTIEVSVTINGQITQRASVPSGASTGIYEALELRDQDSKRYMGKGVKKALQNIDYVIKDVLVGQKFTSVLEVDKVLLELDDTANKSKLGANAILAVSLACTKAFAKTQNQSVWQYLRTIRGVPLSLTSMPVPMFNIINGGGHADNNLSIQEFMIVPQGIVDPAERLRAGSEIYHTLKKELIVQKYLTGVGDEGGFAPHLESDYEALELIVSSIEKAGYKPGQEVYVGMDVAISQFVTLGADGDYAYNFPHQGVKGELTLNSATEIIDYYANVLVKKFPIILIEDGLYEEDWQNWPKLTSKLAKAGVLSVGDDLLVTNPQRVQRGIDEKSMTAMIIKPNQIGSVSEVLETAKLCADNNIKRMASHRSGETGDTIISQIAVGIEAEFLKAGAPSHERVQKYNELLRIVA